MKYSIGIDLGTTNSELAYSLLEPKDSSDYVPKILNIPQFVEPSVIESRSHLPSFLYIGSEEERDVANWALPWDTVDTMGGKTTDADEAFRSVTGTNDRTLKRAQNLFKKFLGGNRASAATPPGVSNPNAFFLVGEIANRRAAEFPGRVVSSAKSWLTHARIDRRAPCLPWNSRDAVSKVSPVEASRRYLAHLVSAWNYAFPEDPVFDQQVVLTVPASFDESARELTREAAGRAGLNLETLLFLEEPQAALYSWIARSDISWRDELKVGDVVLVCDVGGGTTDLSLIRVEEENGELLLRRLAVGNRLLLGGDNIDLAFAHRAAELFAEQGINLNPWQSGALLRQCREAKETLLSTVKGGDKRDVAAQTYKVSILGRSSKVVGESVSIFFPKSDAVSIALEGFFPETSLDDRPKRRSGFGVRESGLPYEVDAAITRHIAAFLNSKRDKLGNLIKPTRFLLNGGIFKSELLAARLQKQLEQWFPDESPSNLCEDPNLESAVALGASYYGIVKHGRGVRIRSASPRSYYIGIETSAPAIPGVIRPLKALCVAPMGMEEGSECDVPSESVELILGETATFRFFSSTTRPQDHPGTVVDWYEEEERRNIDVDDDLQETTPIETRFEASSEGLPTGEPDYVGIRFHTKITELGAMEIWCEEEGGTRSWKLEFSVRDAQTC